MKKTVKTTQYVWENESRLVVMRRQTVTQHGSEDERPIPPNEIEETLSVAAEDTESRGENNEQ